MKYSKVVLGVAMALAMAGANAADIERTKTFSWGAEGTGAFFDSFGAGNANKTFLDSFTFSITGSSVLDGSVTSQATVKAGKTFDLDITSFDLYRGTTLVASGSKTLGGATDLWNLSSSSLGLGDYSLKIGGTVLGNAGGSFAGVANVAAVPEPETWSMVATSLAALGFLARRRKFKGGVAA